MGTSSYGFDLRVESGQYQTVPSTFTTISPGYLKVTVDDKLLAGSRTWEPKVIEVWQCWVRSDQWPADMISLSRTTCECLCVCVIALTKMKTNGCLQYSTRFAMRFGDWMRIRECSRDLTPKEIVVMHSHDPMTVQWRTHHDPMTVQWCTHHDPMTV